MSTLPRPILCALIPPENTNAALVAVSHGPLDDQKAMIDSEFLCALHPVRRAHWVSPA